MVRNQVGRAGRLYSNGFDSYIPEGFWKVARKMLGEHRRILLLFEERSSNKFDAANFRKSKGIKKVPLDF